MTHIRLIAVLGVGVLLSLAATPAATDDPLLTIQGAGSGTTQFVLADDVVVHRGQTDDSGPVALDAQEAADFGAVVLRPLGGDNWHMFWFTDVFHRRIGGVSSRYYANDGLPSDQFTLPAGTYIVHLLAEDELTVSLNLDGLEETSALTVDQTDDVGFRRGTTARDAAGLAATWLSEHTASVDETVISYAWSRADAPIGVQARTLCSRTGFGIAASDLPTSCSQRDLETTDVSTVSGDAGRWQLRRSWAPAGATVATAYHDAFAGVAASSRTVGLLQVWWPTPTT